jgi:hypothetical protein
MRIRSHSKPAVTVCQPLSRKIIFTPFFRSPGDPPSFLAAPAFRGFALRCRQCGKARVTVCEFSEGHKQWVGQLLTTAAARKCFSLSSAELNRLHWQWFADLDQTAAKSISPRDLWPMAPGNPVRPGTGFHDNATNREIGQLRQHLAMREFLTKNHATLGILPMQIEAMLSKINANQGYCVNNNALQKGKIPTQLTAGGDRADHLIKPGQTGALCG